jgi:Rrf2 family protein
LSSVVKISEAASLALHTMVILSKKPDKIFTTKDISALLGGSKAHLSKVLQRLEKEDFIVSTRGPKGGFMLGKNRENLTLLQIYEAIDGPLLFSQCLLGKPICDGTCCILGGLDRVNMQVRDYLAGKKLSDLAQVCKE